MNSTNTSRNAKWSSPNSIILPQMKNQAASMPSLKTKTQAISQHSTLITVPPSSSTIKSTLMVTPARSHEKSSSPNQSKTYLSTSLRTLQAESNLARATWLEGSLMGRRSVQDRTQTTSTLEQSNHSRPCQLQIDPLKMMPAETHSCTTPSPGLILYPCRHLIPGRRLPGWIDQMTSDKSSNSIPPVWWEEGEVECPPLTPRQTHFETSFMHDCHS